ncbi:putative tartrate transporter [compost metagenome]
MLPFVQGHFGLSIFGLTLAALGVFSAMPIILAMPMSYLPAGATAGGIAYVNTIGMLGGFVGPYMMGAIKTATGSFANGLFAVTGLLLIGILIMTLMVRTPRQETVLDAQVPVA